MQRRRGSADRGAHLDGLDGPSAWRRRAGARRRHPRFDIAETRLTTLLRHAPEFAEAWHKRAALYYLLGRDEECLHDLCRTLELEPRHFGAMLHFAEILLGRGARAEARFAFFAALSVHPHLERAREMLVDKA